MLNNRNFLPYDREAALNYTTIWATRRNPNFYDYSELGGDCTNFASQVLWAGGAKMNYQPVLGWYYIDPNQKSPSWTGADFLYNFLVTNQSRGPFGNETNPTGVTAGDLIQLSFQEGPHFNHTLVITQIQAPFGIDQIYVSTHTDDRYNVNLIKIFTWKQIRFIHIIGSLY